MTLPHEMKILSDLIISLPGMMIHCPENRLGRASSPVYVTVVMYPSETEQYTETSNDSGRNNCW